MRSIVLITTNLSNLQQLDSFITVTHRDHEEPVPPNFCDQQCIGLLQPDIEIAEKMHRF